MEWNIVDSMEEERNMDEGDIHVIMVLSILVIIRIRKRMVWEQLEMPMVNWILIYGKKVQE
eukprot:12965814-Ditylum_brightwellii.AAC.1